MADQCVENTAQCEICIIEPFYGGSHKELIDLLKYELYELNIKFDLYTLPAKKWHWRARCSALYFSQIIKPNHNYKVLFTSSVLNLAELIALRNDFIPVKKIVYFHENQLVYPVRNQNNQERDFQYGYNQILTSLAADKVLFNSNYNKTSFLNNINTFLKLIPDNRPKINIKDNLEPKCEVFYFPIKYDINMCTELCVESCLDDLLDYFDYDKYSDRPLHILWPHRWEHDKNPELFFNTLFKLNELGIDFRLSVLGETYSEIPEIFSIAKEKLKDKILNWGYQPSKHCYYKVLSNCDVVISTSLHEFFGVAIFEACLYGSYPILPNRLVYPELYPKDCLYSTEAQLIKKLKYFCKRPKEFRATNTLFNLNNKTFFKNILWSTIKTKYISLFSINATK